MEPKEMIMAWLALLAVIATGFISVRNDVRSNTVEIAKVAERVDTIKNYCCEEAK